MENLTLILPQYSVPAGIASEIDEVDARDLAYEKGFKNFDFVIFICLSYHSKSYNLQVKVNYDCENKYWVNPYDKQIDPRYTIYIIEQ